MRIAVTGATGFIGQHLVSALLEQDHRVVALTRRPGARVALALAERGVELREGDLSEAQSLGPFLEGAEALYHLAAEGHVSASTAAALARFRRVNVAGTHSLLQACLAHGGLRRVVCFSSTAAVGLIPDRLVDEDTPPQPVSPYQKSKREAELAALEYTDRIPLILLRPCMVYGPGCQGEFLKICRLVQRRIFPRLGRGPSLTPIVHVRDVVQLSTAALHRGEVGGTYFAVSEQSYPVARIVRAICGALGQRYVHPAVPLHLVLAAARLVELSARVARRPAPFTPRNILSTAANRSFSPRRAQEDLGYVQSVTLESGVAETVRWFRAEGLL